MACLLGKNRDIFFPKLNEHLHLTTFTEIAIRYLAELGYAAFECATEDEARDRAPELIAKKQWPCYFFSSDTTGEKDFEEFFTANEILDMNRFDSLGVIQNAPNFDDKNLRYFTDTIETMRRQSTWGKTEIVSLFNTMIPDFKHMETGKYLDEKM